MNEKLYNKIMQVKDEIHEACEHAREGEDKMAYKELMDASEMIKKLLLEAPYDNNQIMEHFKKEMENPSRRYPRSGYPSMDNRRGYPEDFYSYPFYRNYPLYMDKRYDRDYDRRTRMDYDDSEIPEKNEPEDRRYMDYDVEDRRGRRRR